MPAEDALGIGINDKTMVVPCIKEHAICGSRADATNGKESLTDCAGAASHHSFEAAAVFFNQYVNKVTKALGLDIKVAGRANQLRQLLMVQGVYLSC